MTQSVSQSVDGWLLYNILEETPCTLRVPTRPAASYSTKKGPLVVKMSKNGIFIYVKQAVL